jgi:hypothetical protein
VTSLKLEQSLFERDTARELMKAAEGFRVDRGDIHLHVFDGSIAVMHPAEAPLDPGVPYLVARRLRGGRDFDPTMPADWHVRAVRPEERRGPGGAMVRVGTRIAFSRTFTAPPGYAEPKDIPA